MAKHELRRPVTLTAVLAVVALALACQDDEAVQTITVSLRNTDTYEYPTVGGDEEGARIVRQTTHHRVSEIRRDAGTNWIATYVYQPLAGYVGSDHAEIEILTGSDGASPPTNVRRVAFDFVIRD